MPAYALSFNVIKQLSGLIINGVGPILLNVYLLSPKVPVMSQLGLLENYVSAVREIDRFG